MRLLMIDNYDSFTFNLVQLFYEFDLEVPVYRHDMISLREIEQLAPDWICISPGPKDPANAGISKAVVKRFAARVPILGVCLGMQVINEVFFGRTRKAPLPVHGKRCRVHHAGRGIFAGIPTPFEAARYHSLRIEPAMERTTATGRMAAGIAGTIVPLAYADDGVIMAVQHVSWPLCGVQFHPESFMTEFGLELTANFLALKAGYNCLQAFGNDAAERFPRVSAATVPAAVCGATAI